MLNTLCFRNRITIGELPTSYLVSLTYEEQLLEINKKLNEIIEQLNIISLENIENLINQKITELKDYVDKQDNSIYNYIDNEISKMKEYTDNQILIHVNELKALINQKMTFILQYIDDNNIILENKLMEQIKKLQDEIDKIIIDGINVYNPTTGKYDNIQNVIYDLYNYLRYYGITCLEFDSLGLTCKDFENKKITAREFDLYSKNILLVDFNHYMYSPFTGKIVPITNVINRLASFHKPAEITAKEFDDLNLTAKKFDDKDLTAHDFDFNAKNLLIA